MHIRCKADAERDNFKEVIQTCQEDTDSMYIILSLLISM